ncbi:MAG: 2-phosphosulfolactate phosphatase [Rhodothermaeota bacterium MED-G19]|nr:MAG: 2-phosphosulfolactate phosphatase [Rhodothermaeota bacterium MED-G19]
MSSIEICLTHEQLENYQHKDKNVVVIDVLRATSTINTILFSGAKSVMPVETLDECMKLRDQGYIIMAERMGKKVEGFDFGNSPTKIKKSEFEGKDVGIATSNGTKAIVKTKGSHITLIGSFLNLSKIIEYINNSNNDVLLVCSGWKGSTNLEDTLCAGAIVAGLQNFEYDSDTVIIAKKLYEQSKGDILSLMQKSSHAKRLSGYDNVKDIEFCSQVDTQEILPFFDKEKIRLL